MKNYNRRDALKAIAGLAGVGALAACTVSTSGSTTTVTIEVAEITADATAALNVVKTVLAFTGIPSAVVTVANEVISGIETALAAWKAYAGTSTVITFDKTSVPTEITSVINAISTGSTELASVVASESTALGASLTSQVTAIASDISSVASIVSSIITSASVVTLVPSESPYDVRQAKMAMIKARHGVN